MNVFILALVLSAALACSVLAASRPILAQSDADNARALVNDRCTRCHSLGRVKRHIGAFDEAGWVSLVSRMQDMGAPVADAEKAVIASFLASLKSGAEL